MGPALLLAAAPAENLSVFDPVSPPASAISQMFVLVLAITGVIFLVVEGSIIYSLIHFRKKANDDGTQPPQVYGSMPIEIAWTAAPSLVVFILVLVLVRTELKIRLRPDQVPAGSKVLKVTVVGHQWWWEYYYESYDGQAPGFVTANELHVPVSEPATEDNPAVPRPTFVTLQSVDVVHSFWVPRLSGKIDCIPGRTNSLWFSTEQPGLYLGQCAEYCGTQHANMLIRVVVESEADFLAWCDNEKKDAVDDPSQRDGRDAFLGLSCINCHTIRGTRATGTFGPDLTHLMSRRTIASGMVSNNVGELRKWLRDPQKVKPGCWMPDMKLSERDVIRVTDYLLSLK
jgi:cytochrome c oxidase subunit 2